MNKLFGHYKEKGLWEAFQANRSSDAKNGKELRGGR